MNADVESKKALADEDIVTFVLEGHTDLFRILVDRYKDKVFHTGMGFLHNRHDAEDLVQEVFLQVYSSLSGFQHRSVFSTWLYRITVNAALNMLRKKSGKSFINYANLHRDRPDTFHSNSENPEQKMIQEEGKAWLREFITRLPEKQRAALVLSYYNDLPQKEIAEILGTTEGAVESLLQRAKENLRKNMGITRRKNQL
ncbi:MAG: RNA polymerase sigma factor [Bacteroidales bacterium]